MLPPQDTVPDGYTRFKPGGPLYSLSYLARHPSAEARLRAQVETRPPARDAPPGPGSEIARLRRYIADQDETIARLTNQLAALQAQARPAAPPDPKEQERRDDVRRHWQAYSVYVLQAILADLQPPGRDSED